MGAAYPPLPFLVFISIAKSYGCGRSPSAKELSGKLFHDRRVVALAAENIEIGIVGVIRKVAADQRG